MIAQLSGVGNTLDDLIRVNIWHGNCMWAHAPLLAVLQAFSRSSYFTISYLSHDMKLSRGRGGQSYIFEIHPGNIHSRKHRSSLVAEMSYSHLRVTVESRADLRPAGVSEAVQFKVHKEWRRGYARRPKWRKFGFYACLSLKQHYALKDAEHVMEV